MKAILLAAGRGSRISRHIKDVPKSTLPVGDIPLIKLTVDMLIEKNIQPIVCLGYKHHEVRKALEGCDVKYYYNPFYDVTNSIGSLWFAREEFDDDMIIANADVYWRQDILDIVLKAEEDVFMLSDSSRVSEGDYFFYTDGDSIKNYGKNLKLEERNCEYVGIAGLKKSFTGKFKERMLSLVEEQRHSLWWENVLYSYIEERKITSIDINGCFWAEIDYLDDYKRILKHVVETTNKTGMIFK